MEPLSIGEVAKRTGVRASALRYYEEAGILPIPVRVGGQRRYDPDVVRLVHVLRFAQQAGFTLEEIKTLFHGFGVETPLSARWQALVRAKLEQLEAQAARIKRMRRALELSLKCGCVRIEDCSLSPTDIEEVNGKRRKSLRGCSC
jgi:MerR family redox-sensitive transcriptional activator SoxR